MTRPYPQDLRDRVIAAVEDEGLSRREAARCYRISDTAAVRWLQALRQGRRAALAQGGDGRFRLSGHRTWLLALIEAEPSDSEPVSVVANRPGQPGRGIYVAPPDVHLTLEAGHVRVVRRPKENFLRPAIDPGSVLRPLPPECAWSVSSSSDCLATEPRTARDQGGIRDIAEPIARFRMLPCWRSGD